jgi:hypothetical protein
MDQGNTCKTTDKVAGVLAKVYNGNHLHESQKCHHLTEYLPNAPEVKGFKL